MKLDNSYRGQCIVYTPIYNLEDIANFSKEAHCNIKAKEKAVSTLLAYEDARRSSKKKVYAYSLRCKLAGSSLDQHHKIVQRFMKELHFDYFSGKLVYLYNFFPYGKSTYVDIIAFERKVYLSGKSITETYKRNMLINSNTGRTTNASDPDAIFVCKKGAPKLQDGKVATKTIYVSDKKIRAFSYRDSSNVAKKKKNFLNFIDRLKGKLIHVTTLITNRLANYLLKTKQYKKTMTKSRQIKILNYNQRITTINLKLLEIQNIFDTCNEPIFYDHAIAYREYRRLFYRLVRIQEKQQLKMNDEYNLSININTRMTFKQLNENLDYFVEFAEKLINQFYWNEFYTDLQGLYELGLIKKPEIKESKKQSKRKTHKYSSLEEVVGSSFASTIPA